VTIESFFFCLDTKESCKEKIKAAEKLPDCPFICFLPPHSLPLWAAIFQRPRLWFDVISTGYIPYGRNRTKKPLLWFDVTFALQFPKCKLQKRT